MASAQRRRGPPKKKTAAATKSEAPRRRTLGSAADAASGRDAHAKRRRGEPEGRGAAGAKAEKAGAGDASKKRGVAKTKAKSAGTKRVAVAKAEPVSRGTKKGVRAKERPDRAGTGAKRPRPKASAQELPGLRTAGPRPTAVSPAFDTADDVRGVPEASHDDTVRAWVRRGQELLELLGAHGCAGHEVRVDLEDGRFVWLAPGGRVSAEARADVICTWSPSNAGLAMAWADPLVRGAAIPRVDGMRPELDDVDEETAFRVAITAAEATTLGRRGDAEPSSRNGGAARPDDDRAPRSSGPEYLYRLRAPHAAFFLLLRDVRFRPERASFTPGAPVGLVLRGLAEARQAIASGAEPAALVRDRLAGLGTTLRQQAESAYRSTDWVARLERTGKRLERLARGVARPSYGSIAAGRPVSEWISPELARELDGALALLEDEWGAFR